MHGLLYTVSQKTGLENLVITLSNVNRVAKFFGHYMQNEIGKKAYGEILLHLKCVVALYLLKQLFKNWRKLHCRNSKTLVILQK